MSSFSSCPRCQQSLVASDVGAGVVRCVGCGAFACTPVASSALRVFLGVDDAVYTELLATGGRGPPCPGCATTMRVARLKGVTVDGCPACGALLLDPGELRSLTGRDEPPLSSSSSSSPSSLDFDRRDHEPAEQLPGRQYAPPATALKQFLGTTPWVQICQVRPERMAMMLIAHTANQYVVRTPAGSGSLVRQEDAGAMLARLFLATFTRQQFTLRDASDNPILLLERHFEKLITSRLDVFLDDAGDPGLRLGTVERNFALMETRYELKDARGVVFARVIRPVTALWKFRVETAAGAPVAMLAKEWTGIMNEYMTNADDFSIDFGAHPWTIEQRAVIVAATLSIDLDFFDRRAR